MKLPIRCPFCNDIMLTDFLVKGMGEVKYCNLRPSHHIRLSSRFDSDDEVFEIILRISIEPVTYIKWLFASESVRVEIPGIGAKPLRLPWFDPDLSDYNKLMEKIKTYLLFS